MGWRDARRIPSRTVRSMVRRSESGGRPVTSRPSRSAATTTSEAASTLARTPTSSSSIEKRVARSTKVVARRVEETLAEDPHPELGVLGTVAWHGAQPTAQERQRAPSLRGLRARGRHRVCRKEPRAGRRET